MNSSSPLRALIIGYGYMGEIRRRVVESLPALELAGICDPNVGPEQTNASCPHYTDWQAALEKANPHIAFVCTPNHLIPEIAAAAISRGIHVFCEKPPGRNVADIRRVISAESKNPGVKVMFGFNHRHHPAVLEAKAMVDGGRLGRILWMRGTYGKSGGVGRDFEESWRNHPGISGGGILLDQGIHMLDLFRFLAGDFPSVQGVLSTRFWNIPVEDNAFLLLKNQEGIIAQLHSSATLWKHTFQLEIGLEEGYLTIQGLLSKTGSYGRERLIVGRKVTEKGQPVGNPSEEVTFFDEDRSWHIQVEELIRCILHDLPVGDSTSTDALRVMQMIEAVYRDSPLHSELWSQSVN